MKAAALAYAQGDGPMPTELLMSRMIDRYGAQAVLHRSYIGAGEAFAMNAADNIVQAYRSRQAAEDWVKWARDNPELSRMLTSVEIEVDDGG